MSESTLSLSYVELRRRVGRYLGYDRNPAQWTTAESQDVTDVILSGLRQFYAPPVEHDWRFLKVNAELDLVAGQGDYDLPDDYGSLGSEFLTYPSNTQSIFVQVTDEPKIRILRQSPTGTRRPELAAVRPKITDGSTGQRFEILFWPVPDAVYTLTYVYEALPYSLSDNRIYPYGGEAHAETILQSCLAAAELHIREEKGPQWQTFMERLQASIRKDKQLAPRNHGQARNTRNYFRSDVEPTRGSYIVTVNGEMP